MRNFTSAVKERFSQDQNFLPVVLPLRALRAHESSAIIFISLGTGSALGEKEKKIGMRQKRKKKLVSGSLRMGKGSSARSFSPDHRYFSYFTPFFALFPTVEPDPRLNLNKLSNVSTTIESGF